MTTALKMVAALSAAALLLAACGDDDDAATVTESEQPAITDELTDPSEVEASEAEIERCVERTAEEPEVSTEEARSLCSQGLVEPFEDGDQSEQGVDPKATDPGDGSDSGGGSGPSGGVSP